MQESVHRLIDRLCGPDADHLTSKAIAKIHQIIDDSKTDWFPDTASQTKQAEWVAERIERKSA